MRKVQDLLLIAVLVLAMRLPFLNHPIQGDDVYYLAGAQHAQINPLHPHQAKYYFQGRLVDMRGHPHPPLNAFILGGLLAVFGEVREVPFHAAYMLFSLLAAFSMYFLAVRFTPQPLLATVLFCSVPAFVINGNSLESDLPFLAFWMLGLSAFWYGRLALAALGLALAGLAAYQSVLAIPILALLTWQTHRRSWKHYGVALTPALAILAYQLFEPTPPVAVALGYFRDYGLQTLGKKLVNAQALIGHLGWMGFPPAVYQAFYTPWALLGLPMVVFTPKIAYAFGVAAACSFLTRSSARYAWWPHIFFGGALVLFFAGSARYLLPMAAPLCLMLVESGRVPARWLWLSAAAQLSLALALAFTNYQHWDGYRQFVAQHEVGPRTWVNGELGLRFYAETRGALPLPLGQALRPGDNVLTSELTFPIPVNTGGGQLVELARQEIQPALPLRLIGLNSRSGYSDASAGVLPFDVVFTPLDVITLARVVEREPTLSYLELGAEESSLHILSGAYQIENNEYRWMGHEAKFLLKSGGGTASATFYIPDSAPARTVELLLDGQPVAQKTFEKPGLYTLEGPAPATGKNPILTLRCDRTFQAPGDTRELGIIVRSAGLR
jgi:hypothetical protein